MTNMGIWDALCETDPRRTKKITGKKYQGDSINPNYIYEKMTGQFGPCGLGWGFELTKEEYHTGNNGDIVHSVTIGLWYVLEGEKSALIPGKGATTFSGKYQSGPYTDEDAEKKSVTDAITKAAQLIGMSADIFGGDWGDSKYIAQLKEKYKDNGSSTTKTSPPTSTNKPSSAPTSNGALLITEGQVKLLGVKFKEFTNDQRHAWLLKNYGVEHRKELPRTAVNEIMKIHEGGMLSPLDLEDDIPF